MGAKLRSSEIIFCHITVHNSLANFSTKKGLPTSKSVHFCQELPYFPVLWVIFSKTNFNSNTFPLIEVSSHSPSVQSRLRVSTAQSREEAQMQARTRTFSSFRWQLSYWTWAWAQFQLPPEQFCPRDLCCFLQASIKCLNGGRVCVLNV